MGLFDSIAGLFDPTSTVSGGGLLTDILGTQPQLGGSSLAFPVDYFPVPSMESFGVPPSSSILSMPQPLAVASAGVPTAAISNAMRMIGFKVAQKVGLRSVPSLQRMMAMIRKMAKFLAPAAVAAALGITLDEMAQVITANSRKKRRRMNPANTRALRRSLRRLESFDRLAGRVQVQLARGHSRPSKRRRYCPKCKSTSCRC
jgi:hypothetical protein